MKRKGFAAAGIVSLFAATACTLLPDEPKGCIITTSIATPLSEIVTKAAGMPDTNTFYLTIRNVTGEEVYCGPYGSKPSEIKVTAGTYELEICSEQMTKPAFESPVYGDSHTVVVSNGETAKVDFLCKQTNCGLRFCLSDRYVEKYGSTINAESELGSLSYQKGESRYGYFTPGNLAVSASDGTPLFNKVLEAGYRITVNLDASSETSSQYMTVKVDTSAIYLSESLLVGQGHFGEDGLTSQTAYGIDAAKEHVGDTVWVWGYIVGGDLSSSSVTFEPPFAKSSNMAIAASPNEKERSKCFSVELSRTAVKAALNLVDNPSNLGCKVFLKGVVSSSYFGLPGIKSVTDWEI